MKSLYLFLPVLAIAVFQVQSAELEDVSGREAKIAATALAKKNELLRSEISRLREEVVKLTVELACSRSLLDEGRVRQSSEGQISELRTDNERRVVLLGASSGWLITAVNQELKLVVFDVGKAVDVKAGMFLSCMKGDKLAAKLRVVEVRERITGAVIEEVYGAGKPEKGDRVVPMLEPK